MHPVTLNHPREIIYAKDQPQYKPLPAFRWKDGTVVTKWHLSFKERIKLLFSGHIYLTLKTFNQPLQPVRLTLIEPNEILKEEE